MTDRRRFLSLMGIGAASAPLAAKELADNSMLNLIARGDEMPPLAGPGPAAHVGGITASERNEERAGLVQQALRFIADNGMPEHVERQIRDEARHIDHLEPDIANKRSWSMAVKIQEQRQRNYEDKVQRLKESGSHRRAADAFNSVVGFKWPWNYY